MRLMPWTVLIAALVLAAGCGAGGGDPTPAPGTSAVVSPTPTPTSSEDALYAEAERVYLASLRAQWKFELTGDYSEFPAEFADYYSPEYLEGARVVFERAAAEGIRLIGGEPSIETAPMPGSSEEGSEVVLHVCYDARGLTTVNARNEVLREGALLRVLVLFGFYDERLKIFNSEIEEVAECSVSS